MCVHTGLWFQMYCAPSPPMLSHACLAVTLFSFLLLPPFPSCSAEVARYSPLLLSRDLLTVPPGLPCLLVTGEHSSPEFIKQNQLYQKVLTMRPSCTVHVSVWCVSIVHPLWLYVINMHVGLLSNVTSLTVVRCVKGAG